MHALDEGTRAALCCPHVAPERWPVNPELPKAYGSLPYGVRLCPGAAARRPIVCDIAGAWECRDQLDVAFPDTPNAVIEGLAVLRQSSSGLERYLVEKASKKV